MYLSKLNAVLLSIILLFIHNNCFGQKALGLEVCIDYAIKHNLDVKSQKLTIASNESNLKQSKFEQMPSLNAYIGNQYTWGRSFDVYTNAPIKQLVNSNNFSLNGEVTIFNGFNLQSKKKKAHKGLQIAESSLKYIQLELKLKVLDAYLQVVYNFEQLKNVQNQLSNTDIEIEKSKELINVGTLPEGHMFELLAQKANYQLKVVEQKDQYQYAMIQLKQLIHFPLNQPFDVEYFSIDTMNTYLPIENTIEIFNHTKYWFPSINRANLALEEADLDIKIAKSAYLPKITLNYSFSSYFSSAQVDQLTTVYSNEHEVIPIGFVNSTSPQGGVSKNTVYTEVPITSTSINKFNFWDQLGDTQNKNIGIFLNIPIYNKHRYKNEVNQTKIQKELATIAFEREKNTLLIAIENAYQDLNSAINLYKARKKALETIKENFRIVEQKYVLGIINVTDFTTTQNKLYAAEADFIATKYQLYFKQKILEAYKNGDINLE